MTNGDRDNKSKTRLASAYGWLVLGWAAIGLAFAPVRGDTLALIVALLPLLGIVFSFIAMLYSVLGAACCRGMRRRFIVPFVLSTPPVAFQIWAVL